MCRGWDVIDYENLFLLRHVCSQKPGEILFCLQYHEIKGWITKHASTVNNKRQHASKVTPICIFAYIDSHYFTQRSHPSLTPIHPLTPAHYLLEHRHNITVFVSFRPGQRCSMINLWWWSNEISIAAGALHVLCMTPIANPNTIHEARPKLTFDNFVATSISPTSRAATKSLPPYTDTITMRHEPNVSTSLNHSFDTGQGQ